MEGYWKNQTSRRTTFTVYKTMWVLRENFPGMSVIDAADIVSGFVDNANKKMCKCSKPCWIVSLGHRFPKDPEKNSKRYTKEKWEDALNKWAGPIVLFPEDEREELLRLLKVADKRTEMPYCPLIEPTPYFDTTFPWPQDKKRSTKNKSKPANGEHQARGRIEKKPITTKIK